MLRRTASLVTLAMVVTVTGCAHPKVRLDEKPREYVATDYDTVLRGWTRSKQLLSLSELDNVLTVTATYESWDFRWAYVARYAEDYRLTVDQRRQLLERSLEESRQHHQFYVALYAQRWVWGDLTAANAAWTVRLIDDRGGETAPTQIEAIRKPGAIELTYFPYTSPWRKVFRIRFPKARADASPTISHKAKWFGLRFAGAQGNEDLVWALEG